MQQQQQKAGLEGEKSIPMINTFLNLCRVCPAPTDDKVNSEYKRNFTWHDGYQTTKVDVIKNAPSLPHSTVEPPLPRKKKHPELAHRTRELLFDYEEGESSDSQELAAGYHLDRDSRARTEAKNGGKGKGSPRSRSADSSISRKLRAAANKDDETNHSEKVETQEKEPLVATSQAYPGTPSSALPESVQKTTEYRSQYVVWKRLQEETGISPTARKSASMGLIASSSTPKADATDNEVLETEISVKQEEVDGEDAEKLKGKKTEYKAKFRPFSAYTYVDGNWKKSTRLIKDVPADDMTIYSSFSFPSFVDADFSDTKVPLDDDSNTWYSEVVERLKKADQYRVRSHAGFPFHRPSDQAPELPPHVRDRSVLSPVSLSSTSRVWKEPRLVKERARPGPAPVHQSRKERKESVDAVEQPKGSPKKKAVLEKATARPKSAEPVIPGSKGENKSPKRTRPRAPKDLPVHGHGDLSGRKRPPKQGVNSPHGKGSPIDARARAVPRHHGTTEDGKVWLKPVSKTDQKGKGEDGEKDGLMNGYPENESAHDKNLLNGVASSPDSVQQKEESEMNGHEEHKAPLAITKPPMRVPLTTVKSPEEVTGVRSPDPESWTVPLEIGKGLQWMDGKTPDGGQNKASPIILSKRLRESSLAGQPPKEFFICQPGDASTGGSVDL